MHLYPRIRNVDTQVTEELKMVTYATHPMVELRRRKTSTNKQTIKQLTLLVVCDGPQKLDDVGVVFQLRGEEVDLGHHLEGVVLSESRCQTHVNVM